MSVVLTEVAASNTRWRGGVTTCLIRSHARLRSAAWSLMSVLAWNGSPRSSATLWEKLFDSAGVLSLFCSVCRKSRRALEEVSTRSKSSERRVRVVSGEVAMMELGASRLAWLPKASCFQLRIIDWYHRAILGNVAPSRLEYKIGIVVWFWDGRKHVEFEVAARGRRDQGKTQPLCLLQYKSWEYMAI